MANSPFRINALNASGNILSGSTGPLKNIMQINTVETLDKIGSLSFVMPANDAKARLIASAVYFDVYDDTDGYLGRYIYRTTTTSDSDGRGMITVQCWNMLKELTNQIAGFGRNYTADAVEDIIDDLISDVSPAWTTDIGTGLGTASTTYQGQTYYQAIEELAKRWGYHFRLNSTLRQLEFGAFGVTNTAVRITNLPGQNSSFDDRDDVAITKRISYKENRDEIYNFVIALGAGEGAAQLQLLDNETGDTYTVADRTPSYGQTEYYISDSTSITAYGQREIPLVFDQIRPIANTATAKTQAQTELLLNAEKWLERYKDPRIQLDGVEIYGLRETLKPGEKINIRYKGLDDEGSLYIDVDDDYWITQVTTNRDATGQRVTQLQLVNVDRAEKTDIDLMADAVKGIKSQRLWIKPTAFSQSDTYTDYFQHGNGSVTNKNAEFTLTFDDTVTDVTRVVLEWRTRPLVIVAATDWYSGWQTGFNSAIGDPHVHNIQQAPALMFQVIPSTNYPSDVNMYINNTLVNNHADIDYLSGGTGIWNSGGTNAALSVRMDVTDFILNAGIYQTFDIEFRPNVARTRDISVPLWSGVSPYNSPLGNHGEFELKVLIQGVAQGVYRD